MEPSARRPRRWLPQRLAVLALVLLAGLVVALLVRERTAGPEVRVVTTYPGLPAGVDAPTGGFSGPEPGWLVGDDGLLAVWAAGSSSCPWVPVAMTADGDAVTVTLAVEDASACTEDLAPTTSVLPLPAGVDPGAVDVELVLDG